MGRTSLNILRGTHSKDGLISSICYLSQACKIRNDYSSIWLGKAKRDSKCIMGSSRSWTWHPLASCVGYWESLLIPSWSFPLQIWVCNPPVESMLPMYHVACSKEVQPSVTVPYLHSMLVVFCESYTLSQLSVTIFHLQLNQQPFESVLY